MSMTEELPMKLLVNENESPKITKISFCLCDENSLTPCIHILAATGDYEGLSASLKEIMDEDFIFNSLDKKCRTVLHCAADFTGYSCLAVKCAEAIFNHIKLKVKISVRQSQFGSVIGTEETPDNLGTVQNKLNKFVNARDRGKFTALYLAAKRENTDLCYLLLRRNADWEMRSWRGKSPAVKIFKKIPSLIADLIEEFTPQQCEYEDGQRSRLSIDFGTILTYPTLAERKSKRPRLYEEMAFLANMGYTPLAKRMDILKQPLVQTLIWLKWQKIKWFVYAARSFQVKSSITWFFLYSIYLIVVYRHDCPYKTKIRFQFHYWFDFEPALQMNGTADSKNYCQSSVGNGLVWILLVAAFIDLIFFQLPPIPIRIRRYWHPMKKRNARKYFKRIILTLKLIHAGKLMFLIIVFVTLYPMLVTNFTEMSLPWDGWYIIASIGIGLAWFYILLQIGKLSSLKTYVKMLTRVLRTLGLVLLIYGGLIIAFAMVFCILLPGMGSYASPIDAILKIFTFFVGEINYDETFYGEMSKSISIKGQGASIIVFAVGIVILNVALLNFIIGLTVADIQDLKQYTETWRNYSLLWQIYLFDTFLSHFPIQSIGHTIMKRLMIFTPAQYETEDPNFKYTVMMEDLPKHLRKQFHAMNLNVTGRANRRQIEDITFMCVKKSHSRDFEEEV